MENLIALADYTSSGNAEATRLSDAVHQEVIPIDISIAKPLCECKVALDLIRARGALHDVGTSRIDAIRDSLRHRWDRRVINRRRRHAQIPAEQVQLAHLIPLGGLHEQAGGSEGLDGHMGLQTVGDGVEGGEGVGDESEAVERVGGEQDAEEVKGGAEDVPPDGVVSGEGTGGGEAGLAEGEDLRDVCGGGAAGEEAQAAVDGEGLVDAEEGEEGGFGGEGGEGGEGGDELVFFVAGVGRVDGGGVEELDEVDEVGRVVAGDGHGGEAVDVFDVGRRAAVFT